MIAEREIADAFACFGGSCGTIVRGDGEARSAADAVALARRRMLAWHDRFTRFEPGSELSSVNCDPRDVVPVSATMALLAEAGGSHAVELAERPGLYAAEGLGASSGV